MVIANGSYGLWLTGNISPQGHTTYFWLTIVGLLWHGGMANKRMLLFPHVEYGSEEKLMTWGHPSTSKWRSLRILILEVLLYTPCWQKEFPLISKEQLPLPNHLDKVLTDTDALQSIVFFSSKSTTTQLFFAKNNNLGLVSAQAEQRFRIYCSGKETWNQF